MQVKDSFNDEDDVSPKKKLKLGEGWKNPITLATMKANKQEAETEAEHHFSRIRHWLTVLDAPSPVQDSDGNRGTGKPRSKVQPKLVRKNSEWRYPSLSEPFLNNAQLFRLRPLSADDVAPAHQNEMLLNYQFKARLPFTSLVDTAVRDYVDTGVVIGKVSWIREEEDVEEDVNYFEYTPIPDMQQAQELIQQYQQLMQLQQLEPDTYNKLDEAIRAGFEYTLEQNDGSVYVANFYETKTETVTKLKTNRPHLEICEYDTVIIDPTCKGQLENAKFVIHSTEVSIADLKADSRYKENLELLNEQETNALTLSDDAFVRQGKQEHNFKFSDKPRQKIVLHEYWGFWDINGDGYIKPIVAAWVGNVLIRLEENPYPDGQHPFVMASFLPKRGSLYGEPDAELIEDNQNVTGAVWRSTIDMLGRSASGQTGTAKDFLDPANLHRFQSGDDYSYNPTAHPANSIYQHTQPQLPNTVSFMLQNQAMDAESLTGVKAFGIGGITGKGFGETAAAVETVVDSSAQRTTSILRRLGEFFISAGRKFIALNAIYLSEEEVVRLTNKEFVQIRKDDLAGNFDVDITVATAEADTAKANDLGFILQTAASSLDPTLATQVLAEICRLRHMPQFAKKLEEFEPQPDPLAEEERKADIQLKLAQAELLRAQAQETMAKATLNGAKVNESEAKTGKITQEAQAKAIDNQDAMSGERHLRDLDKARVQQDTALLLQESKNQNAMNMQDNKLRAGSDNLVLKNTMDALSRTGGNTQ